MMRRRGLTIIELLFGLFVVFTAVCMLAGVMVSTYSWFHRLQDRTTALQLAKMAVENAFWNGAGDQAETQPGFPATVTGTAQFTQFQALDPTYWSQTAIYDARATTPSGATVDLQRAFHQTLTRGLCVSDTGIVAYAVQDAGGQTIRLYNDAAGTPIGDYAPMPLDFMENGQPIYGYAGGMACDGAFNTLYVSDIMVGCYTIHNPLGTRAWGGGETGYSSLGYTIDNTDTVLWGTTRHQIWSAPTSNLNGATLYAPLPPSLCVAGPNQIAINPISNGDLWFGDEYYMCLRHYSVAVGWDNIEYKPAWPLRMGLVRGMAYTNTGVLVVLDGTNIWQFTSMTGGVLTGTAFALPPNLVGSLHAMGTARNGANPNFIYVTDYADKLYRFDMGAQTLTQIN